MPATGKSINFTHPLQTDEWAGFRREWGNEILKTEFGMLTLHRIPYTKQKIGMFIKSPTPTKEMLKGLRVIAGKHNLIFIKLEPRTPFNDSLSGITLALREKKDFEKMLIKAECVKGKTLFTPTTFWIDLTKTEDELLKGFTSKTRYNIRLADKKGVVIKEDNSDKAFEKYLELTFETTARQGFYAHTPEYHRLMWKHLHTDMVKAGKKPIARLLTAVYQKQILTTWILFAYDGVLYYPYGASTDKYKEVMANNLMMWEAIKIGKREGLKYFDLWGREEGKGFTKFKEGYSPYIIEFLGTWDLVINKPMYKFYLAAEKLRWKLLRLKKSFSGK